MLKRTPSRIVSWLVVLGWAPVAMLPASGGAQVPGREQERVLFVMPHPEEPGDSAYVVELAAEVRRRLEAKYRQRLRVIPTEQVCEMLTQSGYRCDAILTPVDAARLARALQSDAYIIGTLSRNGPSPMGRFRLVDIGRSGLAGYLTVRGTAGEPPRRFAETVVDSFENRVRAAEYARECLERRDRADYRGAIDRAERAFALYRDHPSAALCAAVVLEAQRAPTDSQIAMYDRAVQGDSLLERGWERLGRLYQEQGDSLKALGAFRKLVHINPDDRERWLGVLAGYITVRGYEDARELADDWLGRHPGDLPFLQLKERACTDAAAWGCVVDALAAQYAADSSLVGDTIFYAKVIGAAQAATDTAAWLEWSGEAARRVPQATPMLRTHAGALATAGMTDSVVKVYDELIRRDSSDIRSMLLLSRILSERLKIDTVTPLDTATLQKAEQLLDRMATASQDTSVLMNVSALYLQPGVALARIRADLPRAIRLLEKALATNVAQLGAINQQANFFIGWALLYQIFEFDREVVDSKSCELVQQEAELIRRGRTALEAGAQLLPAVAQQFLDQYRQMEARIPELRRAFQCR